jgi:hypothetical protein
VESKRAFTQSKEPKPSYTPPQGKPQPIDPRDRHIDDLRRELDRERWANREIRQRRYFEPYYSRPVVIYQDPFHNFFWWWLLSQSLDTRASWAYHHRRDIDDARYREMLRRDIQLEERLRQLEAKGVQRDPSYTPPGLERDLMYSDEYVDAVYNPRPDPTYTPPPVTHPAASPSVYPSRPHSSGAGVLSFILKSLLVIALLALVIWLVFFKRWGAGEPRAASTS